MKDKSLAVPVDVLNALRFYANQEHFYIDSEAQNFDTVSGEPDNWLYSQRDEDCTMIEDGSIARAVLQGRKIHGDMESQPVEGEVYGVTPLAQRQAELPKVTPYKSTSVPEDQWRTEPIDYWLREMLENCDYHDGVVIKATLSFLEGIKAPAQEDEPQTANFDNMILADQNQTLRNDMERLRQVAADLHSFLAQLNPNMGNWLNENTYMRLMYKLKTELEKQP